jgi:hypothetical protein
MDDITTITAPVTDDEFTAIVERLQNSIRTWKGNETYRRSLEAELHMIHQFRRLDLGVRAIRRATVTGSVCDDVAWFDTITTLFDYCSTLLGDDVDVGALVAAYPHPSRRPKTQATPPKRRRTAP